MATLPPVSDPRFDPNYAEPFEFKPKRSPWVTCLIGCLATLVVLFIVGIAVVFWITRNIRGWASTAVAEGIKQGIEASDLPQQEKLDINQQVDRVANAYRTGRLTNQQLGMIMQKIVESPLMTSVIVLAAEQKYFANSGLSDEEKAAGRITLQRFLRGVMDDKISQQAMDTVMGHIAVRQPNGEWRLRQQVSDADLRAFLGAAKAEADKAGVAADPPNFDPSDEFKRIVDEAMAQPDSGAGE